MSTWQPLAGGTMSTVEVRGDVVRRSTGFWTPPVHALLRHLEAAGFDRAPRVLGVDDEGRELLTLLPGQVPSAPRGWSGSDDVVVAAAQLLRRYHDAVATFPAGTVEGWDPFFQEQPSGEVICHNDFATYNCTFVDGLPWGMIDFDGAAPGSRVWDLAWTAVSFVPFDPDVRMADRPRRLRLLCDAYGLADRVPIVDAIEGRLSKLRAGLLSAAGTNSPQAGTPPGHVAFCLRAHRLVQRLRPELIAALH